MRTTRSSRRSARQAGFTITEVLMTTVIMGTAFAALSWMMTSANRTQSMYQEASVDELQIAREIRELALSVRSEPFNGNGIAITAADVLALDNLNGATFKPPVRADLTPMTHLSTWTQRVELTQHTLADIANAKSLLITQAPKGTKEVFKLSVTLFDGNTEMETYEWVIKP